MRPAYFQIKTLPLSKNNAMKTIRLFVSSTFKDMDVERDALRTIVVPHLNACFAGQGLYIQLVDLRHSVETNAALSPEEREKRVFDICVDEIEDCKPFFIGLVGHRYGWIPDLRRMRPDVSLSDVLPSDFPLSPAEISVTVYEFVRGLFNSRDKDKALVLMRSEASYAGLDNSQCKDYVDEGPAGEYQHRLRSYLYSHQQEYNLMEYTLDVSRSEGPQLEQWCKEISALLMQKMACEAEPDSHELSPYLKAQHLFIQNKTFGFLGRGQQIQDCLDILERRGTLYICEEKTGLGQTALLCRLYSILAQDSGRCCLFSAVDAHPDGGKARVVLYNWCLQMTHFLGESAEALSAVKDDESRLFEQYTSLITRIYWKTLRPVVIFMDDNWRMDHHFPFKQAFTTYAVTVKGDERLQQMLAPYVLCEMTDDEKLSVAHAVRSEVRRELIKRPASSDIKWLSLASSILEHLNKADYTIIRNAAGSDQEGNITRYLLDVVADMPDNYEELCVYWIRRLMRVFGTDFVTNYTGALASCYGLDDEVLAEVTGQSVDWCIYFRQMLGRQLLEEDTDRLWRFTSDTLADSIFNQVFSDHPAVILKTLESLKKLPSHLPVVCNNLFAMSLYAGSLDDCVEHISHTLQEDPTDTGITPDRQAFVRYFRLFPYRLLDVLRQIVAATPPSYAFYHGLNRWCYLIKQDKKYRLYTQAADILAEKLEALSQAGNADSGLMLALAEIYMDAGSAYVEIPGEDSSWDRVNFKGRELCRKYKDTSLQWSEMTMRFLYDKYEGFPQLKDRWKFLLSEFVPLEEQGITYAPHADFTYYSLLLRDTALLIPHFNPSMNPAPYIEKAYQVCEAQQPVDVYQWLLTAWFMNRLAYDSGCLSVDKVHDYLNHVLEETSEVFDNPLASGERQTVYARVLAAYAMSVGENDPQLGLQLTDALLDKVLARDLMGKSPAFSYGPDGQKAENSSNDDTDRTLKYSFYLSRCFMMSENHVPVTTSHLEMPFAWMVTARYYIQAQAEDVSFESVYPLISDDQFKAILAMLEYNRPQNIWDRELDVEPLVCHVLYAELARQSRHGFPDEDYARKLADKYIQLFKQTLMHYRYINWREHTFVKGLQEQLEQKHQPQRENMSQELLESLIDAEDYDTIIRALKDMQHGNPHEFYYLGLAFLRGGQPDNAVKLYHTLVHINNLPQGFHFSCKVNYLYALLVAGLTQRFAEEYDKLDVEEKQDSDICDLYECYQQYLSGYPLSLPLPFGYKL